MWGIEYFIFNYYLSFICSKSILWGDLSILLRDGVAWEVQQQQRSFRRSIETSVGHGISFLSVAWHQLSAALCSIPIRVMTKMGILQRFLRAVCLKGDIWLILINCVIKLVGVKESDPEHPVFLVLFWVYSCWPLQFSVQCVVGTWTGTWFSVWIARDSTSSWRNEVWSWPGLQWTCS